MKKIILNTIKAVLPIGFGIFLIWYVYDLLSGDEKKELFLSFKKANYYWIILALFFGILSHVSRAYRWNYLLEPLNYKSRFLNNFFSVMIGYGVNMLLPRAGEVTRCVILSKYEKIPLNKLLGTVIAERIADFSILICLTLTVILVQIDTLQGLLVSFFTDKREAAGFSTIIFAVLICSVVAIFIIFRVLKKSSSRFVLKFKILVQGIMEGLKSIVKMKNRGKFIFHTFFIWLMYLAMFYISFFSLPETAGVPLIGMLAGFVMGGLSIVFIQGGIGVYPAAVMEVLFLYGVDKPPGLALGWIIWSSQTLMIVLLSILSMLLITRYNKIILRNE